MSALVVTLPVQAAQLQSWWFDSNTNRLSFLTDVGVQPRAQMIFNPTRIVVDLPGTTLGRPTAHQTFSGAVREVRVGQFDPQTARLVIELDPGYSVDPQQVEIRGIRANQWIVQLPSPQPQARSNRPSSPPVQNQITGQTVEATTRLESIVTTPDGFFLRTQGPVPELSLQRRDRKDGPRQITIDLLDTSISERLRSVGLPENRYSIRSWEVQQLASSPPQARITLTLDDASPDWRVTASNLGGIIVVPPAGVSINTIPDQAPTVAASTTTTEPAPSAASQSPAAVPIVPTPAADEPPRPTPNVQAATVPNERVVVVIDPGHGGRDPGAVGIAGLQEKQVIFPISLRVRELLEQQGVQVVMTRYDDRTLELQTRVDIAERADADLFVSIHANAINLSRPDVNGIETYYFSAAGRRLAEVMHASMLSASGMNDRGVRQARFFVLRRTSMPATLLEVGFVTGAQDAPRLSDPAWRERMAGAIAQGILRYIQQNF
ncbi:N-acetylmuramoyl-L-alanine amidase [Halomicronema hongdechloris C2206]|uniref:N-acetylmuramoyl-L-alanine amidase n=1 Tax=Halomicronema hongdechloris C2206 TaxID=1641165 RepID=A0A1Z3HRW8_9CYAN|nr:N-acetylmuramoyl-L-alanine amidase [Halomicronema hongdechloris]ASC73049.1 N-acetylmuramoyl-L-alanine amidase [Halomicronema hongdechloris C2206]